MDFKISREGAGGWKAVNWREASGVCVSVRRADGWFWYRVVKYMRGKLVTGHL